MKDNKDVKQNAATQPEQDSFTAAFDKVITFFEQKWKLLLAILGAVILIVAIVFLVKKLVIEPRNNEANNQMFAAQNWFGRDQYDLALNGNKDTLGFIGIIDEYGSTKSGKLAYYYAGVCEMKLGKFEDAYKHLKKVSVKDTYIAGEAKMLMGDAKVELGDWKAAISLYLDAAKASDNAVVAPAALLKAGIAAIQMEKYSDAVKYLTRIKAQYPNAQAEVQEADRYIGYAEAKQK